MTSTSLSQHNHPPRHSPTRRPSRLVRAIHLLLGMLLTGACALTARFNQPIAVLTPTAVPTRTPLPTFSLTPSPQPTSSHTPAPSPTPVPTLTGTAVSAPPTTTSTPTNTPTTPPPATPISAPTLTPTVVPSHTPTPEPVILYVLAAAEREFNCDATRIYGTVQDANGKGIPGITVRALGIHETTGQDFTTQTDAEGRYEVFRIPLPELQAAQWAIMIMEQGREVSERFHWASTPVCQSDDLGHSQVLRVDWKLIQ